MINLKAALAIVLVASPALAVEIGDKGSGLRIAEAECTECHAVLDNGAKSANPNAPTFPAIANTPGMTAIALRTWFRTPHPTMPNLIISEADSDDLIAYIQSLKKE